MPKTARKKVARRSVVGSFINPRSIQRAVSIIQKAVPYVRGAQKAYTSYNTAKKRKLNAAVSHVQDGYDQGKRRPRKTRNHDKRFLQKGFVSKQENGGLLATPALQTQYIGHSCLHSQAAGDGIMGAIIKYLFNAAGKDFVDFDKALHPGVGPSNLEPMQIRYRIRRTWSGATEQERSVTINTLDTPWDVAEALVADMQTYRAGDQEPFVITSFSLFEDNNTSGSFENYQQRATFRVDQGYVHIKCRSRLALQNRTLGVVGGVDTDVVDNNPVVGKLYGKSQSSNAFLTKQNLTATFVSNDNTAVISETSALDASIQKPPNAWFFGANKQSKVSIKPGGMVSSVLTWNTTMKLEKYFNELGNWLAGVSNAPTKLGKVRMFGLEKKLDALRTGGLNFGFEITNTHMMYVTQGQPAIGIARNAVGVTPIV
uniref:Capsid protein n=1 Tax=Circoviridae sp. TaxID=1954248 RepID=A0A345N0X5_9VIRU